MPEFIYKTNEGLSLRATGRTRLKGTSASSGLEQPCCCFKMGLVLVLWRRHQGSKEAEISLTTDGAGKKQNVDLSEEKSLVSAGLQTELLNPLDGRRKPLAL